MADEDFRFPSDNPYQVGESVGQVSVGSVQRPTSVTVFGTLNIVFGVLGICGVAVGSVSILAPELLQQQGAAPNPAMDLMANNAGYRAFLIVSMFLGMLATIVLIIAGIGLLTGKPFGRSLSIYYAWYTIISSIVGILVNVVFVFGPMLQRLDQIPNGPERFGVIGGLIGGVVGGLIGLIYPVLMLIFMKRQNVVEFFNRPSTDM